MQAQLVPLLEGAGDKLTPMLAGGSLTELTKLTKLTQHLWRTRGMATVVEAL